MLLPANSNIIMEGCLEDGILPMNRESFLVSSAIVLDGNSIFTCVALHFLSVMDTCFSQ